MYVFNTTFILHLFYNIFRFNMSSPKRKQINLLLLLIVYFKWGIPLMANVLGPLCQTFLTALRDNLLKSLCGLELHV